MHRRTHSPHEVRRFVILIEHHDGTQHGYDVTNPTMTWEWTGLSRGGRSTARIVVSGECSQRHPGGALPPLDHPAPRKGIGP